MPYPRLFAQGRLGRRAARNRIVSTSHGTNLALDGFPSDTLIAYHAAKAKGGCGTVMLFGSAAVSAKVPIAANHVNLWKEGVEPGLRRAAAAVREHGALALSQATCMGRRTNAHADLVGHGPSDTGSEVAPQIPHVLEVREIREIVDDYAAAAAKLAACGFDGVDLAFYDDQLPDQFWSPAINHRTDAYGGSLENRMRFSLDVLRAVRAAAPADFIVGARISGDDRVRFGLESGELLEIAARLAATGLLDYFTVTAGTISTFKSRSYNIPTLYEERGTFVPFARRVRERVAIPVIVTGRIVSPQHAEEILEAGEADFVGMTRALIADPELPRKAAEGRENEIRTCMGTGEGCIDRLYFGFPITCVQNPAIGRELTWGELQPAARRKRVAVVGAGPAGLEAARVAAERGHAVVLFEREAEVGGAIRIAARAPGWSAYRSSIEWLAGAVARAGVDVRLACAADVAALERAAPDAVVFATGARPRKPYLAGAGLPHVVTASAAIAGDAPLGKRCVVLDEIGYTLGPKAADALASRDHEVTIVTRQYALGEDVGTTLRAALIERLLRAGVEIVTLALPLEIVEGGVRVAHTLTDEERLLPADSVVVASGGVADDALYRACAERFAERYLIGDAFAPRQLRAAMSDGGRAGRAL